jgi:hypothetical protein
MLYSVNKKRETKRVVEKDDDAAIQKRQKKRE